MHRDSPGIEPEEPEVDRPTPHRRFARLVEATTTRRVALHRLVLALGILTGFAFLVAMAGSKIINLGGDWVATQADHQLPFSKIELVPEPDPWVIGGKAHLLEQVRLDAGLGRTLPLLKVDLKALKNEFKLYPWVEDVSLIRLEYGHLSVHLTYRKPVAIVVPRNPGLRGYVIDREAVPLPAGDIAWGPNKLRHQVQGMSDPLIEIRSVEITSAPKFGVPWKRPGASDLIDNDDPIVLGAARLADFLQKQSRPSAQGRTAPSFVSIWLPGDPGGSFFLQDSEHNWVNWGKAPGEEKTGELSSEERWEMLLDWLGAHGKLTAKNPDYLYFTRSGAAIHSGKPDRNK